MGCHFEIREGGTIFNLAAKRGKELLYDFPKILIYLEAKGKLLFGKSFRIYEEDKQLLYMLSNYFIKDQENCRRLGIDINKGILISGPVGCGKTSSHEVITVHSAF